MKTAIGIVTFGNHQFTRLGLTEIFRTVKHPVDICVVIGKPGDWETQNVLAQYALGRDHADGELRLLSKFIIHKENKGFPGSINDIYDWAFVPQKLQQGEIHNDFGEYDNLIIMGNDVVPYPGAIDALIDQAERSDHDCICSCMYDVKSLVRDHPEAARHFTRPNFQFTDFNARPWDMHGPEHVQPYAVIEGNRGGLHDLTLFKRSVFEKIGYIDVNFFPAYFSDNDYWRRGLLAGVKFCSVTTSCYFHFWSRTIHQGGKTAHTGGRAFQLNEKFYRRKWGGGPGGETFSVAFDGKQYMMGSAFPNTRASIILPGTNIIASRSDEPRIIEYWKAAISQIS